MGEPLGIDVNRRRLLILAAGSLTLPAATAAFAESGFPDRLIRLIVPFPPGGGTDLVARTVALKLAELNHWTVVVENRPGAGGNLGVDAVAKATPDGYTLVIGQTSNLAINATLYPKLPYKPIKDFAPVALISSSPIVVATGADSRFKSFRDVMAAAAAKQEAVTVGFSGNGTVSNLSIDLIEKAAGVKLRHVPYKGASQAMTDLMSGQIDLYLSSVPTLLGFVRSGKIRALAITSKNRAPQLAQTPTVAESGYPGFDAVTWFGILAPAGTPPAVVAQLNAAITQTLKKPDVAARLQAEGGDVIGGSSEDFSKLLASEVPRWGKVVKDSGATVD